jgi:beta-mannosidase
VSSATNKTINSGDIHFWKVWAESFAIEAYQDYVGRFNSEYGMQSMPEMSSLQQFTRASDLVPGSEILRLHERHPQG